MKASDSSVVVRGVRAIARSLRSLDEGMTRAAADKDRRTEADAGRVRAIIADSRLVQAIERLFAAPAVAWPHSRVRAAVSRARHTVMALEPFQRVRLLGWMIVVAVTTRAALYVLAGNRVSSPTLAIWALVFGAGAFMMAVPRSVAVAWVEWRRRRS
jgi:hypothetical protein